MARSREEAVTRPRPPLRVLLGGDVMLGRGVGQVLRRLGPEYPLQALAELAAGADLFFVNLECALSARQQRFAGAPKAFYFRADPEAVLALTSAGVDLVSLANNHVLDAGVAGLADTLAVLARHGIAFVGAGPDLAAAGAVRAMERGGWRLGVLAACDHQADFAAAGDRPGIHYLDLQDARSRRLLVERVRAEAPRYDHLVVALHWLPNWVPSIPPPYRDLAEALIDAGARVLWGHSPHHILGAQFWPRGVALYSTGDLVDDYALDPHFRNDRQVLYLLELGEACVARVCAYPLKLGFARAEPADQDARGWIEAWLRDACHALGGEVVPSGQGFALRPGSPRSLK